MGQGPSLRSTPITTLTRDEVPRARIDGVKRVTNESATPDAAEPRSLAAPGLTSECASRVLERPGSIDPSGSVRPIGNPPLYA